MPSSPAALVSRRRAGLAKANQIAQTPACADSGFQPENEAWPGPPPGPFRRAWRGLEVRELVGEELFEHFFGPQAHREG